MPRDVMRTSYRVAPAATPPNLGIGVRVKLGRIMAACIEVFLVLLICAAAVAQKAPELPLILKGAQMGAVKFDHVAHLRVAGKCDVCHHASKPEKPLKAPQEVCTDCHTKPPTPPVTTGLPAAFHNAAASEGLCIDCHKRENSGGKAAPVKCAECHQKANG